MPKQIKLIKKILDHVDAYKNEVGNTDIKEFVFSVCSCQYLFL